MKNLKLVIAGFALIVGFLLIMNSNAQAGHHHKVKGVVNINTATLDELKLLGLKEKTAQAILDERDKVGGNFKDPSEIKKIVGKAWHKISHKVVIEGETTLKPAAPKTKSPKDAAPAPANPDPAATK